MAELLQGLGDQVHALIQTLFQNNTVFHDKSAPIHTAVTIQSLLEEHEGELQLLL
jgi:hypothetical protein